MNATLNKKLLTSIGYHKKDICSRILPVLNDIIHPGSIILFQGQIGSGKTCLITNILRERFGIGNVTSPTFCYVNRYKYLEGVSIYHYDLYRLQDMGEVVELGLFNMLGDQYSICLIEWPEVIYDFINDYVVSKIDDSSSVYLVSLSYDFQDNIHSDVRVFHLFKLVKQLCSN